MATQHEVRRAIMWADMYLDRLYKEISWGGKTYGLLASHPSTPIAITLEKPPEWCGEKITYLQAGDYVFDKIFFVECILMYGLFEHMTLTTVSNEPERWEGVYQNNYDSSHPVKIRVIYEPHPADSTKMQLTVKIDEVDPTFVKYHGNLNLYVGGNFIDALSPINNHVGESVTLETQPYGCFPSSEYSFCTDVNFAAYYYWYDRPALRNRAVNIFRFLDDYSQKPVFEGVFYRATDQMDDSWNCDINEIYKACPNGILSQLPRGIGYYPHFSRCCYCRFECQRLYTCRPRDDNIHWISAIAIHAMNKYGDPKKKIPLVDEPSKSNSAEDYLLTEYIGFTERGTLEIYPGLLTRYVMGKGFPIGDDVYSISPFLLLATIELGYGFNYPQVKEIADDMVDILLKVQWGYPFEKPWEGRVYGYTLPQRRPDHTGGFMHTWAWEGGVPKFKSAPPSLLAKVLDIFGFRGNPPDTGAYTFTWAEYTKRIARALRIYDAYKFRLGGS